MRILRGNKLWKLPDSPLKALDGAWGPRDGVTYSPNDAVDAVYTDDLITLFPRHAAVKLAEERGLLKPARNAAGRKAYEIPDDPAETHALLEAIVGLFLTEHEHKWDSPPVTFGEDDDDLEYSF